jgi:hypothetical protein
VLPFGGPRAAAPGAQRDGGEDDQQHGDAQLPEHHPASQPARPAASARVISPAGMARQPLAFWPHHRGEKSPLPAASAAARRARWRWWPTERPAAGRPGAELAHQAVDDGAGRAAGEQVGEGRVAGGVAGEGGPVDRAGAGFGAQQVGAAHLHAGGAQGPGGGHAAGVGNAAGGDHRQLHRCHDLRHQRQGAELGRHVAGEEHAPVAAGFEALGDHRVGAAGLQPAGFVHGGGGAQHAGAAGLDAGQQLGRRQAEVEAHHRRAEGIDQLGQRRAEGRAAGAAGIAAGSRPSSR